MNRIIGAWSVRWRALLAPFAVAAIVGCGSADPGVGSGGTGVGPGTQQGTVSGFGSVIVEGNRYDDSIAQVTVEIDPAAPKAAAATDLRLGMQIELTFDSAERAATIRMRAEVIGAGESNSGTSMVVAGQSVRVGGVDAVQPVLDGLDALTDLKPGDRIAVYGLRSPDDAIVATRIERLDAASGNATRVAGTIASVAADARSLRIGALTVDLAADTRSLPAGAVLAAGQRVAVYSSGAPNAGHLSAQSVAIGDRAAPSAGVRARVGGLVRNFDAARTSFQLEAFDVDAAGATFVNGTPTDLANGRLVRVTGDLVAGRLRASEVRLIRNSVENEVDVLGAVGDFVSNGSFTIRSTRIDASDPAIEYHNGTAADLISGARARIRGRIENGVFRATRVDFEPAGSNGGSGSTPGSAAGSGTSGGGTSGGGTSGGGQIVTTEGLASAVDVNAGTLRVNGVPIVWTAGTRIDGNLTDLAPGVTVKVEGTVAGGILTATRITIRP